jgi:hypothetical protein
MNQDINTRLLKLEQRYSRLLVLFLLVTILLLGSLIILFSKSSTFNILRAKGIVIEDATGRDRILIGSPIPSSKDRVRTDTALVRKYWASKFDEGEAAEYMQWYTDYDHGANGIVVMNEQGFDRVLVGDQLADPNTGKRMFNIAGVVWNNPEGWELGGAGVNTTRDGKSSRSIVGVDDGEGEAVHMVAFEDGTKGLIVGGANGRLLIGMAKAGSQWFKSEDAFTGIKYYDPTGKLIWAQEMK